MPVKDSVQWFTEAGTVPTASSYAHKPGVKTLRLFADQVRNNLRPAGRAEGSYGYLNSSGRPEYYVLRNEIESWFAEYPDSHKASMLRRFKTESEFTGAFFELFMHRLLGRLGFEIEVHPEVPNTARSPDFLATPQKGHQFYLEAVVAEGVSDAERGAIAVMSQVYDSLNQIDSTSMDLGISPHELPRHTPSTTRMRTFIQQKMQEADLTMLRRLLETDGTDKMPRWTYSDGDWSIEFYPLPRAVPAPVGTRLGLVIDSDWRQVDYATPFRRAISRKANRYGALEIPYVVAVNVLTDYVHSIFVKEALFGTEILIVGSGEYGPSSAAWSRKPDGIWRGPFGPRNKGLSAVLVIEKLKYWNAPRAGVCLYHCPWARNPYTSDLARLPQCLPQDGHLIQTQGETLSEILGLSTSWPE